MEKRSSERIPVNLKTEFYCRSVLYSAVIMNLSQKGMFINLDEICFPADSQLEVLIKHNDRYLQVPVNIRRIIMNPNSYSGIGVEIIDPAPDYLEFIDSLMH